MTEATIIFEIIFSLTSIFWIKSINYYYQVHFYENQTILFSVKTLVLHSYHITSHEFIILWFFITYSFLFIQSIIQFNSNSKEVFCVPIFLNYLIERGKLVEKLAPVSDTLWLCKSEPHTNPEPWDRDIWYNNDDDKATENPNSKCEPFLS